MCNSTQGEYVGNSVQFSIFKFKRKHLLWEFGDQMFNGELIEGWATMEKYQLRENGGKQLSKERQFWRETGASNN